MEYRFEINLFSGRFSLNVNEVITFEELKEKSKRIIPERSSEIMTVAEKLREEGKREGKIEGKREGIEKIIYKLLVSKFGKLPEGYRDKLKKLNEETLEIIAQKILEIEDFEELDKYIN